MKLKPETEQVIKAVGPLLPAYNSTSGKARWHISNLAWEILVVAAHVQGCSVDDLDRHLRQSSNERKSRPRVSLSDFSQLGLFDASRFDKNP